MQRPTQCPRKGPPISWYRRLVRSIRSGSVNAALPLTNRDAGAGSAMGDTSATFNAAVDNVSGYGTLVSTSYGLEWKPAAKIHLDA